MIRLILSLLAAATLFSCSRPDPDEPGRKEEKVMTDEEKFNSVILKKDIEALPDGTYLTDVEREDYSFNLKFSNGKTFILGRHSSAFVCEDRDGFININGKASQWKTYDCPHHTISPSGNWVEQGVEKDECAFNLTSPKDVNEPYVLFLRRNFRNSVAYFSDGSSRAFNEPVPEVEMYVKKTANQMDVYIGEKGGNSWIDYPFKKRSRAWSQGGYPAFLDNWGISALKLCTGSAGSFGTGTDLFLNGEAEMAIQVTDGADPSKYTYVGGTLHGFENILTVDGARQLTVTVDGREIGEDGVLDLCKADKIVMTQKSELCQAYTNTNPFARADRLWTFENGRLTIKVTLTLLRDMSFNQGMFGMLCVLRRWEGSTSKPYLTRVAFKDSAPGVGYDVTDGWAGGISSKDPRATRITEYGDMGWSFTLAVDSSDRSATTGGMFVGTNGNGYNKIYFDMIGKRDFKAGDILTGQVHWEIERTR